jgi:AraC-like DNA-binding protein
MDPAAAHLGIAEIAYRLGYRSVATFNKAFRDLNDCTPSEYRSAHLASAPAAQSIR